MKYSIILPCYNEAESIVTTLKALVKENIPSCEILVVDDQSPDNTAVIAEEYAKDFPFIRILTHKGKRGLSPSVVYGFEAAEGEILLCMDADGQHRVEDVKKVLAVFENNPSPDMVIGSRHVPGGGFTEKWNFFRSFMSWGAALLSRICLSFHLFDPMSGFFAVRKESFKKIAPFLDPEGFKIMLECAYLLHFLPNAVIREEGIVFAMRQAGESKLTFHVITQYLAMLIKCRKKRKGLRAKLSQIL